MKPPKTNLTPLDTLINSALGSRRKLRQLEEGRKLTYSAFLQEALELADCDQETIEQLGHALEGHTSSTQQANTFIRKLVATLREPNYPRCPRDPARCLRVYGNDGAFVELQGLGSTVSQAIALSVMQIKKRFGDEAFGEIEDWSEYEKETKALQNKITGISEKMPDVVSGLDLEFNFDDLNAEEKRKGLTRVTFRRAPGVVLADGGWPLRLVEDCERPIPREAITPTEIKVRKPHKRRLKRERLAA